MHGGRLKSPMERGSGPGPWLEQRGLQNKHLNQKYPQTKLQIFEQIFVPLPRKKRRIPLN